MPHTDTPLAPDTRGRGLAATIYVLYLGSIMAVVTAPIGVLIAHVRRGRVPPMADSGQQVRYSPFTSFVNVLGWPAITVPVCRVTVGARSLPASVQLVARPGQEALLLRLATDVERAVGAGVSP